MPGVSIVIVAAGSGSRMGQGDKLFLDIAGLPPLGTALGTLRDTDLALTLEAKDVRFGAAGSGTGTIAARIQSNSAPGPSRTVRGG